MTGVAWFVAGFVLCALLEGVGGILSRHQAYLRRKKALELVKRHRMRVHTYLAGVGIEDPELRLALNEISSNGSLILNEAGDVVGKIAPTESPVPNLRLVVSSD